MSDKTLADIAKAMKDIDIAMLLTHTEDGAIAGRPMSNNREVEYNGDSYYFTFDQTRTVSDIERDPKVALSFQGDRKLLGRPGMNINVEGQAEVVRDPEAFRQHWNSDLNHWFDQGADTPGLVMVKVQAKRVHYWDGQEEGEIPVR
ncbi:MAG: pyridoxamine 5'-phosphate oxidase family protein [Steroidobacteraceae bacterium]